MSQKILNISIYLLVFLMPLFCLPFSFEVFEFNKGYLLAFLVSIGVLAWLGKMVFKDKRIKFKKNPLDIFVLVFLLVMILNTVFSVDKVSSLFGFYGRFWPNLIGTISLCLFYFLITNNVTGTVIPSPKGEGSRPKPENKAKITINGLLKTFLWSSFFVVVISYFSILGVWTNIAKILPLPQIMSSNIFNTVGSLEQLAMFLSVVFVFLIGFLSFREKEKRAFWLYLFLFAIFILFILIDFKSAWLVIALSLFLFLAFSFKKRIFKEDVNRLSLGIIFLIISLIFLFFNPLQGLFQQIPKLANLPKEILPSQGTSWEVGFQGLKNNIVSGSGEGTFNYLFSKYKPQIFLESSFWQLRFDRAGNHIAEMLGTTGVLGILSYFSLIGMFLMISWIVLNSKAQIFAVKIQLPLFLTFFALLLGQFCYYQSTTLAFSFWLFLALGALNWQKVQKEKVFKFENFPEIGLVFNILFWLILIGIGFFYFLMIKYYIADVYYRSYLLNPQENFANLEKTTRLNDSRAIYHMTSARAYLGKIFEETDKTQPNEQLIVSFIDSSVKEARRATEISPNRIAAYEVLAIVYREIQGVKGALEKGIESFNKALELDPKNPILLTELGKLQITNNQTEKARTLFNKAIELKKDYLDAAIQLVLLDEKEGKKKEALKKLEDLATENPFSVEVHFQLGRFYYNEKEYDKAIVQFQNVLAIFPNHSNSLYSLGLCYEMKGEKDKALKEYEKVLELNPKNTEIESKIETLERKTETKEEEKIEEGGESE